MFPKDSEPVQTRYRGMPSSVDALVSTLKSVFEEGKIRRVLMVRGKPIEYDIVVDGDERPSGLGDALLDMVTYNGEILDVQVSLKVEGGAAVNLMRLYEEVTSITAVENVYPVCWVATREAMQMLLGNRTLPGGDDVARPLLGLPAYITGDLDDTAVMVLAASNLGEAPPTLGLRLLLDVKEEGAPPTA